MIPYNLEEISPDLDLIKFDFNYQGPFQFCRTHGHNSHFSNLKISAHNSSPFHLSLTTPILPVRHSRLVTSLFPTLHPVYAINCEMVHALHCLQYPLCNLQSHLSKFKPQYLTRCICNYAFFCSIALSFGLVLSPKTLLFTHASCKAQNDFRYLSQLPHTTPRDFDPCQYDSRFTPIGYANCHK